MIDVFGIQRSLIKSRLESELTNTLFDCVICGAKTTISVANRFNYYLNRYGSEVDNTGSDPRFNVLLWDTNLKNHSPGFLVCGNVCRTKFLRRMPYDAIMTRNDTPIIPKKFLGSKLEDFLASGKLTEERIDKLNSLLTDNTTGFLITGENGSDNSKLMAALIYELRCLDKTVIYLNGFDLAGRLAAANNRYNYQEYKAILNDILPYNAVAIDRIDAIDFKTNAAASLFMQIDNDAKLLIASSPKITLTMESINDRLKEICDRVELNKQ